MKERHVNIYQGENQTNIWDLVWHLGLTSLEKKTNQQPETDKSPKILGAWKNS